MIVVGIVLGLGVLAVLMMRGRRGGGDVQRVQVDGAKPWAGPARLNGSSSVRLPSSIPRPVQRLAAVDPEQSGGRPRAASRGPRLRGLLVAGRSGGAARYGRTAVRALVLGVLFYSMVGFMMVGAR